MCKPKICKTISWVNQNEPNVNFSPPYANHKILVIPKSFTKSLRVTSYFYVLITCPTFLVQSVQVTFLGEKTVYMVYTGLHRFTSVCPPMLEGGFCANNPVAGRARGGAAAQDSFPKPHHLPPSESRAGARSAALQPGDRGLVTALIPVPCSAQHLPRRLRWLSIPDTRTPTPTSAAGATRSASESRTRPPAAEPGTGPAVAGLLRLRPAPGTGAVVGGGSESGPDTVRSCAGLVLLSAGFCRRMQGPVPGGPE